jgi:hypothetical protein
MPGDLIVGLSRLSESVIYIMEVKEKMTFADYWGDRRFRRKRPSWGSKRIIDRCGDNCYEPARRGATNSIRQVTGTTITPGRTNSRSSTTRGTTPSWSAGSSSTSAGLGLSCPKT